MGLLRDLGEIEDFQTTQKSQQVVKRLGLRQFLHCFRRYSNWKKTMDLQQIKWGEEIQGHFLQHDQQGGLRLCTKNLTGQCHDLPFKLMLEYGSWMFEMIPDKPYNTRCNFNEIIQSIREKYASLQLMKRIALTIPVIPLLGVRETTHPVINNTITNSMYVDDQHISDHPRFRTLTKHIRMRRGRNVDIFVPLFMDKHTNVSSFKDQPREGYVHLDAMAFGMGLACLQCTFSTKCLDNARYIYDQLNIISPLFLALTAGSPFFKGKLVDWDVRWNIISNSVDDRNEEQRDPQSANYLPSSRYSEADYYLWNGKANLPCYNDFNTGVKPQDLKRVEQVASESQTEMDPLLVNHIANLFKRDVLIVNRRFFEMTEDDYTIFEMLNGTNWNSVRLKIPIDDEIGWRVEFRTMEVQLTADENSAYSLAIHLITRIFHTNTSLNLYIPISKLRENFERAHRRDAVRKQKFYFRTNICSQGQPIIEQLTLGQIMFGKDDFRGLFHVIEERMTCCVKVCPKVRMLVASIRQFLHDICFGKRLTLAQWMREYIAHHQDYKHDSVLSKKVMDDLLMQLYRISKGQIKDANFYEIFHLWDNHKQEEKEQTGRSCGK